MKKGSLLIIEDDPVERMAIGTAFVQIGIQENIYTVGDGEEAIAFLMRQRIYIPKDEIVIAGL